MDWRKGWCLSNTVIGVTPTDWDLFNVPENIYYYEYVAWSGTGMDWRIGWWRSNTVIGVTPTDWDLFNVPEKLKLHIFDSDLVW